VPARFGVPLAVLAVAAAGAWWARDLPVGGPEGPGPAFVPLLLAGLLALLALALLLRNATAGGDAERAQGPGWAQAFRALGLLGLYVAGLAYLGYFPATLPFVALAMWLGGARSPVLVLGTTVGFTFGLWLVLTAVFAVPLPRGPWL
jgi:hypothetical protein